MTLEQFVNLNYEAAILLYKTGRMKLLTDDPYYLSGEATDAEAMVLLSQRQLTRKNNEDLSPITRHQQDVRDGVRPKRVRESPYKGISRNGARWSAYGNVATAESRTRKVYLGTFTTAREAALAYDVWATAHGRKTNAQLGLL